MNCCAIAIAHYIAQCALQCTMCIAMCNSQNQHIFIWPSFNTVCTLHGGPIHPCELICQLLVNCVNQRNDGPTWCLTPSWQGVRGRWSPWWMLLNSNSLELFFLLYKMASLVCTVQVKWKGKRFTWKLNFSLVLHTTLKTKVLLWQIFWVKQEEALVLLAFCWSPSVRDKAGCIVGPV